MKVKVCGMRDQDNLSKLVKLNPDFIGFIFYEKSKRYLEKVPEVNIAKFTQTVGVFVNAGINDIVEKVAENHLNGVQLHGDESPEFCKGLFDALNNTFGSEVFMIKAFSISESFDFQVTYQYSDHCRYFLFDTAGKGYGGTGKKFDWSRLGSYTAGVPFLLSGGIQPVDYEEINKIDHPQFIGVDINSGFEQEPGIKKIKEIQKFKEQLR